MALADPYLLDPTHEAAAPERMRALQRERLAACVDRVFREVPFYRRKLEQAGVRPEEVRALEDLSRLPFTTKNELREHSPFGLLAVPRDQVVRVHSSSGTTGKATVVAYSQRDLRLWAELVARTFAPVGIRQGSTLLVGYGYGLVTAGLGFQYGAERLGALVVPSGLGGPARQLALMRDLGADALLCTPSCAMTLVEEAERMGGGRPTPLAGVFGGEPWSEALRERLEAGGGLRAFDSYGLSEVLGPGVAFECQARQGLHLSEDHFLPEVVEPETGRPLPEGELGELVLTAVTRDALPVLRYRTRDLTRLTRGPCACGRTLVRMARSEGRLDDRLIFGGRAVMPLQLEDLLLRQRGTGAQYQICLSSRGAPELRVEGDGTVEPAGLERELEERARRGLGVELKARVVARGALPRGEGKARRVIHEG
jgi:phenylacetate-CoA ligase